MKLKTGVGSVFLLIVIFVLAVQAYPVLSQEGGNAWTSTQLSIRIGPGTNYARITVLPFQTMLFLEGRNEDSSWVLGRTSDGVRGWVSSKYLIYQAGFDFASLPLSTEIMPAPSSPSAPPAPGGIVLVADFSSGIGVNNLGGAMGAAYQPNSCDMLTESYPAGTARLEYNICAWAAFWLKLQGIDLSGYTRLSFKIRADDPPPTAMKIELKRDDWRNKRGEWVITHVKGITSQWQTMVVPLLGFVPVPWGNGQPLTVQTNMDEVVFTFEAAVSGSHGVVYLDDIVFLR